ncbi:unnamed protein product, partial [Larinioides sclopetarius]
RLSPLLKLLFPLSFPLVTFKFVEKYATLRNWMDP